MRIGIDIKAFKNGSTGIARHLRSLMDRLQVIDEENDYFLFSPVPSPYEPVNPRWRKIIIPWKLPGILWQQFVLPRHLRRHGIEVLWAPEQIGPVLLPSKTRLVTTIHDLTHLRFPDTCQLSNRLIQRVLLPRTIARSSVILPVSNYIAREVRDSFGNLVSEGAVRVVYNGAPDWQPPTDYSPACREPFLFFPGNLEPRKNLERLIGALELLKERFALTVPLHISGPEGWKNHSFHDLVAASPVRDQIRHLGYLSGEELKREYLTCKALVYPSLYEGFGIPPLEALSLDCLVLTSRGTVMEEILGSSALYFDPTKIESFAEVIRKAFEPSFDRERILLSSHEVLSRYSWEQSARSLLDAFMKLT